MTGSASCVAKNVSKTYWQFLKNCNLAPHTLGMVFNKKHLLVGVGWCWWSNVRNVKKHGAGNIKKKRSGIMLKTSSKETVAGNAKQVNGKNCKKTSQDILIYIVYLFWIRGCGVRDAWRIGIYPNLMKSISIQNPQNLKKCNLGRPRPRFVWLVEDLHFQSIFITT